MRADLTVDLTRPDVTTADGELTIRTGPITLRFGDLRQLDEWCKALFVAWAAAGPGFASDIPMWVPFAETWPPLGQVCVGDPDTGVLHIGDVQLGARRPDPLPPNTFYSRWLTLTTGDGDISREDEPCHLMWLACPDMP